MIEAQARAELLAETRDARRGGLWRSLADIVTLTKPRITAMVIITLAGGIALAHRAHPEVVLRPLTLVWAVLGTALVVGGANALNMYLERESDGLMERTRQRPLPSGRLAPGIALAFGLALSLISVPLLTFGVNATTGLFAAIALVSYVLVYTPLKRKTSIALFVGAVPGAIPPLLGWTSVADGVELQGMLVFAVLFFWQIPHFLAIAIFRKKEYERAGLAVLPSERGEAATRWHIVAYTAVLVTTTVLLFPLGVGGVFYLSAAVALGAGFLGLGLFGFTLSGSAAWAKRLFFFSIAYLTLLMFALLVNP